MNLGSTQKARLAGLAGVTLPLRMTKGSRSAVLTLQCTYFPHTEPVLFDERLQSLMKALRARLQNSTTGLHKVAAPPVTGSPLHRSSPAVLLGQAKTRS